MGYGFSRYIAPVDIYRFFTEFGGSNYFYKAKYNIIACIQMIYYFSLHVDKRISTYLQLGGCKL